MTTEYKDEVAEALDKMQEYQIITLTLDSGKTCKFAGPVQLTDLEDRVIGIETTIKPATNVIQFPKEENDS